MFAATLRGIRETGRFNEDAPQQASIAETVAYVDNYVASRGYTSTAAINETLAKAVDLEITVENQKRMIADLQNKLAEKDAQA